jgi:hypothetical protein
MMLTTPKKYHWSLLFYYRYAAGADSHECRLSGELIS